MSGEVLLGCPGFEIEPNVYSGCDAAKTGARDCPTCGDQPTTGLPLSISRCHHGGYHTGGAGPCCDTVEMAVRVRNKKAREDAYRFVRDLDRRNSFGETWRECWRRQGYPGGVLVGLAIDREGRPLAAAAERAEKAGA